VGCCCQWALKYARRRLPVRRAIGVNDAMRCDAVDAAAAAAAAAAAVATSPPDEINHDLFCRRVSLRAALN